MLTEECPASWELGGRHQAEITTRLTIEGALPNRQAGDSGVSAMFCGSLVSKCDSPADQE